MSNTPSSVWLVAAAVSLLSSLAPGRARGAGPLDPREVPEALRPWVGWVLFDKDEARCPMVTGADDTRR